VEHSKGDMERICQKPFCHGFSVLHLWLSYFMIKLPNSVQHHTDGPRYDSGTVSCNVVFAKCVKGNAEVCPSVSLTFLYLRS
jgi:hypothetical protein